MLLIYLSRSTFPSHFISLRLRDVEISSFVDLLVNKFFLLFLCLQKSLFWLYFWDICLLGIEFWVNGVWELFCTSKRNFSNSKMFFHSSNLYCFWWATSVFIFAFLYVTCPFSSVCFKISCLLLVLRNLILMFFVYFSLPFLFLESIEPPASVGFIVLIKFEKLLCTIS